jgi:UDP-glucuronate 4-epimerase
VGRVLVTGGAGFIGSHVCEALARGGREVVALDCFDDFYDPMLKRRNLEGLSGHRGFRLAEGDIRDAEFVDGLLDGVEIVLHLAARAGVRPSIEQPLLYQDVNVRGTTVLLDRCRARGVGKFIFASSSSVYGNNESVPFREDDPVDHPISPYAATKKAGELIAHVFHHLHGIEVTCLRFFTVYGPRQRPDLAIHKFARLIETGRPIPVYGDGSMMRDFTYIDDVVDGVLRATERFRGYRVYNLGESRPVALRDLIGLLEEALCRRAIIDRRPMQPGDVQRTFADVSRARTELGYEPSTEFRAGLERFVAWFRAPGMHGGAIASGG